MTVTTIDKVVRGAIAEAGYKNLRKYILFLHFAFDALYKLKRDNVIVGFKFLSLPVVDRRATIPANVLAMGMIGWQRGVVISTAISAPQLSLDPAAAPGAFDGGMCWGIRYKIDRSVTPVQIIFERQPPQDVIYVEVIESTDTPTTETAVASEAVLPMKSYIHFRNARFKSGAASAEAKEAEKEYFDEVDEAMAGLSDLTGAGIWFALSQKEMRSRMGIEYPFYFGQF
jgi:hypothetical protein